MTPTAPEDTPGGARPAVKGWRPLQLRRDLDLVSADGRALNRSVAAGDSIRLRRGVVVNAAGWDDLKAVEKYLLRMRAVAATRRAQPVFSHQSAAVLWGLPIVGRWPDAVHLMVGAPRSVHSKNGVIWHHDALSDEDVVTIDGMLVTSLVRTLLDLARTTPFLSAVASLDHGTTSRLILPNRSVVAGVSKEQLLDRLHQAGACRGSRAAFEAISFSDNRSDSPGESLSRGQIHLCRFPAPDLQVTFPSVDGHNDTVDFRWIQRQELRTVKLLGEFDGFVKYTRAEYLRGRTIDQVVWDEKVREDRVRLTSGHGMARWLWDTALRADRLRSLLLQAGLRPE
ncbi:hypothetical protein [Cryobacterium sp. PH31-O1]|uniref:hypothetical protein n=1 Tax=Cryobacterium sp. PH31-O1 TaxID=3046306 RepID=UPI0024BA98CC|nr:hypothetical protein [Cryobacterium sp. PH31-O1]MDJ0338045.1 hypothetical protein [Cryobacterium sp. PH31-O1]